MSFGLREEAPVSFASRRCIFKEETKMNPLLAQLTHRAFPEMAETIVISNQKLILANQKAILANQKVIQQNQKSLPLIVKNQNLILKNQATILARLPKK